jgi:DNA-directed RNA polymerase subunit M/transcription elongation factor TFIIS
MSEHTENKEYDIEELRKKGSFALATVIKQDKNVKIIEKYIHKRVLINKSYDYDETYMKFIYQSIGDILVGKDLKLILENIKKDLIGWDHPTFLKIKNRIKEHDDFIVNPFEVEEGVTTCNCGSGRVFTYQKQTRGADEPMTTFAKCVKCKSQWTYSG